MLYEELLFEREDAEHQIQVAAHLLHSSPPPRPNLRRHQVNHGNALALEMARHPQMEVRGVGEDGQGGPFRARGGEELAILPVNPWNIGNYLPQPHHGQAGQIHHRSHAGCAHLWAGAAEELPAGLERAQFAGHQRSIKVAGSLACRNQDLTHPLKV